MYFADCVTCSNTMALSLISDDPVFNHFINNLYKGNEFNLHNRNK